LSNVTSSSADAASDANPDLGALVGSRICHDLISPLGAIGNGVELIALSGFESSPEIALIAESVDNANARIRLFRIAFGAAGAEHTIGAPEITAIVDGLSRTGRHRIDWLAGPAARIEVKLAFLILLCVASALPWGGNISVRREGDRWRIAGSAAKVRVDPVLWTALAEPPVPMNVSSADVEFPLARDTAMRAGRQLSVTADPSEIVVTF
jgi:histidine phosphotransferase ChpT